MLNLQQQQKLQQKLSPQQIQYIKLLQLPTLALEQRIKAEMEENPLLEEGSEQDLLDGAEEPLEELEREGEDDDYDWEELLSAGDDLYGYKARVDQGDEDDREAPMPARTSITQNLEEQLRMLDLSELDLLIADQIIGSIDEDGYLRRPLESIEDDIVFNYGEDVDQQHIENVLRRVQRLDPAGIAARDLRECLLIQLETMPDRTPGRRIAQEMLRDHYKAFTMKHFKKLMKALEVDGEELKDAFELIQQRCDPKPGEGEFTEQSNYITPDFTVRFMDGDFVVTLNGRNAPELRVSRQYRQMLEQLSSDQKKRKKSSKTSDHARPYKKETRQFLKDKFESAKWFINSVQQRRNTLMKVMQAMLQLQEDFFRYGEGHLKPMILEDVADIIEMDISTVSRVVNGKYVQCDFGVYELKYFFSEGLETESGEEMSNKEARALLEGIIAEEDKRKPLSDQKLADALEEKGLKIARRTVTKYREQLGLPVARLRKEIVLE